jgi:hypothetical protein
MKNLTNAQKAKFYDERIDGCLGDGYDVLADGLDGVERKDPYFPEFAQIVAMVETLIDKRKDARHEAAKRKRRHNPQVPTP